MFLASESFGRRKTWLPVYDRSCTFPSSFSILSFTPSVEALLLQVSTMECKYIATNRFYDYCHCNSIGEGTVFSIAYLRLVSSVMSRSRNFCDFHHVKEPRSFGQCHSIVRVGIYQSSRLNARFRHSYLLSPRRFEVCFSLTSFVYGIWWLYDSYMPTK